MELVQPNSYEDVRVAKESLVRFRLCPPIPVLPSAEEAVAKGMVIIIPKPTNSHFKKSLNIVGTIIGGAGIPARCNLYGTRGLHHDLPR